MNRKAFPDLVLEVVEGTLHAFVCPTGLSSQELPHAKKKKKKNGLCNLDGRNVVESLVLGLEQSLWFPQAWPFVLP